MMTLKNVQVRVALDALKDIQVMAIADESLRSQIIGTHLALLDRQETIDKHLRNLEITYLGKFEDRRAALGADRDALALTTDPAKREALKDEILAKHHDIILAEKGFKRAAAVYGDEPGKVDIDPIPRDGFVAAMLAQGWDFSRLELIYPLLSTTTTKK